MSESQTTLAAANHFRDAATRFSMEAWNYRWLPLISVVIPTYRPNRTFLGEALASVAAQSYSNWEICIVDDASPDRTAEAVVLPFSDVNHGRVRFRRLESNLHISGASNACLELAGGDYIALLDHDDRLFPDALEHIVRRINEFRAEDGRSPEVLYSDEEQIDEWGDPIPGEAFYKPDWSPQLHRRVNYTTHLSVYARSLVTRIGGFRAGYEGSQDYDLMLRAVRAAETPVQHVPELLYQWRAHSRSTASALENKSYAADAGVAAVQDHLDEVGVPAVVTFDASVARNHVRYQLPAPLPPVMVVIDGDAANVAGIEGALGGDCAFEVHVSALRDAQTAGDRRALHDDPAGIFVFLGSGHTPPPGSAWLTELVSLVESPGVGLVGGLVLDAHDQIQSAGLTIDGEGRWIPRAKGEGRDSLVYKHTLRVVHEVLSPDPGLVAFQASKVGFAWESISNSTSVAEVVHALARASRDRGLSNVVSPEVVVRTTRTGGVPAGQTSGLSRDPFMNRHLAQDGGFRPLADPDRPLITSAVLNEIVRPDLVVRGAGLGAPRSPAAFQNWVTRPTMARWSGFPESWTASSGLRFSDPARIGVVLHVFYPELIPEILERLEAMPVPFDLLVTNSSGHALAIEPGRLPNLANHVVLELPNRGRDILPLVALVNADLLAPYDVILKVHTKQSAWRADHGLAGTGAGWRRTLLDSLIGNETGIVACLKLLAEDPRAGFVTAPGSVLGPEHWGDNEGIASELIRRLELPLEPQRLRFAAGSMYWVRGFLLQALRSLNLSAEDFEVEDGQVNQTTAHALERLLGRLADEAGYRVVETPHRGSPAAQAAEGVTAVRERFGGARPTSAVRVVPFLLPQFHPIAENDQWWGPGFTEWTNVTSAKAIYPGHHQPKLPRDLGFYDLSHDSVAVQQERLARAHGVGAFMYYHYWFAGDDILGAPLAARLDRSDGLPFCLMWANENWTRRWDGRDAEILLSQDHHRIPPGEFLRSVVDALKHPDYLRVDDDAILAVYRPGQIPDVATVVKDWRAEAAASGVGGLHLLAVDVPAAFDGLEGGYREAGFDGIMAFPPHNHDYVWLDHGQIGVQPDYKGNIFSYAETVLGAEYAMRSLADPNYLPGVMVGFDNVARRQLSGDVWYGSNPFTFRRWLAAAVRSVRDRPSDSRIVFVNAWNEWAEGAMLEPSDKFGLSYLQAVRDVIASPMALPQTRGDISPEEAVRPS